jgi:uncharacterized protein
MRFLIGLITGAIFGLGLVLSQMTDPQRILGFLDVFGRWDPRLAFVMIGAIAVHAPFVFLLQRHRKPRPTSTFDLSSESRVDARLVMGAGIFGVGWGIAGFCPGPAVVAALRNGSAALLVISMIAGMWFFDWSAARASEVHSNDETRSTT